MPTKTSALPSLFRDAESAINEVVLERQRVTRGIVLAILNRSHVCLIGKPGVAKSMQLRLPAQLFGLSNEDETYWEYQFDAYTTPDEVDGPISVRKLTEEDAVVRIVNYKLPRARLAYLDEIFEAGGPTRKSLNSQLNERIHYNPNPIPIPLSTVVASSNLLPDDQASESFVDRFLSWFEVHDLQHPSSVVQMLMAESVPKVDQIMTWADVEKAQVAVAAVKVPLQIAEQLAALRETLHRNNVFPSPRRFKDSLGLIRANAWLNGRDEAQLTDIRVLRDTWTRLEDIGNVTKVVLETASDLDRLTLKLQVDASDRLKEITRLGHADNRGEAMWKEEVVEAGGKLKRLEASLMDLAARYEQEEEPSPVFEELYRFVEHIGDVANETLFKEYLPSGRNRLLRRDK